ncbi:hypothetical protein ACFQI7_24515 [Paenibacillus allorhizosphaerae]|uniref:hypothetical protein n=2 Tax=Paenibacillus allorhizosphaerae TaxID=2849866 RepID=UPI0036146FFA
MNLLIYIVYYVCVLLIVFISGIWLASIFGRGIFKDSKLVLSFLLGFLWLILVSSWSSFIGLTFERSSIYILGISIFLSLIALAWEIRTKNLSSWQPSKNIIMLVSLAFVSGIVILSPVLIFKAINLYNDAFTYLSISDYLLTHSYFDEARPDANSPWLTQMKLYQVMGYRMGSQFFLSLITAIFSRHFSLDLYISVLAIGQFMLVLAIWLFNKYVMKLSNVALTIIVLFTALHIGIPIQNTINAFFPQAYGMVIIVLVFTFMIIAYSNNTGRIQHILLSSISIAALVVTYSELVPFAFISMFAVLIYLLYKDKDIKSLLLKSSVIVLCAILLSNIALIKAFQAIKGQLSAVVGHHIDYTLWNYVQLILSLHPIMNDGSLYNKYPIINLILSFFTVLCVILIVIGFSRNKLSREFVILYCLSSSFLLMLFYFIFVAHNPWNTAVRGHSWNIYKTVQYLFVLVPSFVGSGIMFFYYKSGITRKLTYLLGLTFISLNMMLTYYFDYVNTSPVRSYTGNKVNPLNEYYKLYEMLKNEKRPINIIVPDNLNTHTNVLSYILRDHILVSDWSKVPSINHMLAPNDRTPELRKDAVTLIYKPNSQSGAASMEILQDNVHVDIVSGVHSLEQNKEHKWYWSSGDIHIKTINTLDVKKTLSLTFIVWLPPTIKDSKDIEILYKNNLINKINIQPNVPNPININIPIDAGEGSITLKYLGEVVKVGGDPRQLGFSLVDFHYSIKN